jgi:hypothetical protein
MHRNFRQIEVTLKTKEELDNLKYRWLNDPIWDIWTTEGFEEHEQELIQFQTEQEQRWVWEQEQEFKEFQKLSGTTRNNKMAKYLYAMSKKIMKLENDISVLKGIRY